MEKGGGKVRESWKKDEQVSSRSGDATKGKIKNAKGDTGGKVARSKGEREGMKSVGNEQKLGKVTEVREVRKTGVGTFKLVDDLCGYIC